MNLKLKILKINKYNEFILQDQDSKKEYSLILEFYGINKPKINDILLLDERLLDKNYKGYSQPYAFEKFNDSDKNLNETDLVGLVSKDKKYILKRVYG